MPDEQPKSRPQPPPKNGQPSVYGDQWGSSGKQNETEKKGQKDRPTRIETPEKPQGTP